MIVAFALNITLLPALILMRPAVPAARVGWAGAAPVDAWLHRHRRAILWAFVLAMAVRSCCSNGWCSISTRCICAIPMRLPCANSPA
jgi:hypothetical protein